MFIRFKLNSLIFLFTWFFYCWNCTLFWSSLLMIEVVNSFWVKSSSSTFIECLLIGFIVSISLDLYLTSLVFGFWREFWLKSKSLNVIYSFVTCSLGFSWSFINFWSSDIRLCISDFSAWGFKFLYILTTWRMSSCTFLYSISSKNSLKSW